MSKRRMAQASLAQPELLDGVRGLPLIARQFLQRGLPPPRDEYQFAIDIGRRWRVDFAWPGFLVALEIEGAVFAGGRHTRGAGFMADLEKYNELSLRGWLLLRHTHDTIRNRRAINDVIRALVSRGWVDMGVGREG